MAAKRPPTDASGTKGEVVYRRMASADRRAGHPAEPRFDPALMPLLIGFALLLLFVLFLGNLSVRRVEDTSREVLDLEHQLAARTSLVLQLRAALTRLDNEARDRMTAEARRELRPPVDMRLDNARDELDRLMGLLDHLPLSELPKWQACRTDLQSYLAVAKDLREYSLHGFESFRTVDSELSEIQRDLSLQQEQVFQQSDAMQRAAARSIRLWSLIAILAGLIVTAATIWEMQRRFRLTRRSMDEARREREFSTQMLEGMVSAIAAIDRHDRIRSANAAFFHIFQAASIGSSIHDHAVSEEGLRLLEAATASQVVSSTYRGRWNLKDDGGPRTYDVYSSPLEIDRERGQLLTLVDVTEATAAEAALRHRESLAAVGQATAQLAHEIKNPLGSIRLGVAMLRENAKSPAALKTLSLVERGINHLNKLVIDVTGFSRQRRLERADVDLHQLIDSSIELVSDRIQEKGISLERSYAPERMRGYWDGEQLREVFVNILANAIDASEVNTQVQISTELVESDGEGAVGSAEPGRAHGRISRITFTDYGWGIDQQTLVRIFDPFFTTKKRGTGLGLAIVRQIIEAHDGTISVTSEPGKGTKFIVDLPGTGQRGFVRRSGNVRSTTAAA